MADEAVGDEGRGAGHREIDHTADVGFEVWAPDLPGLIREATLGLAEICYDRESVLPAQGREMRAAGESTEEMLVAWLREVYLLVESERWLCASVEAVQTDGRAVSGRLLGEPYEPGRHTLHTEIKAITYHRMAVARDRDGLLRTLVIVDV